MAAASNTKECIREVIGKTVKAVLFDTMPVGRADLSRGTKTLVFDDGTGLTFASNGSFWSEVADDVRRGLRERRTDLERCKKDLEDALIADGALED